MRMFVPWAYVQVDTVLRGLTGVANTDESVLEPVFRRRTDAIRRALQGFSKAQPLALASDLVDQRVLVPFVSHDERLAALDAISISSLREFCRGVFKCSGDHPEDALSVTALLHGNVASEDIEVLQDVVSKALSLDRGAISVRGDSTLMPRQCLQAVFFPAGTDAFVCKPHTNPDEVNAGLTVSWQIGVRTPRNLALGKLLSSESQAVEWHSRSLTLFLDTFARSAHVNRGI